MEDVKKILSDRMRKLREMNGLTQGRLSELLGVEPATVSRWESGANWPRARDLDKLAEAFRVPISALFDDREVSRANEMISKNQLLEMIASGKLPATLLPPPPKPSVHEALEVIAKALEEREKLLETSARISETPKNPKLSRLLSSIEKHPTVLDLALNMADAFEAGKSGH